jgi:hypothetical protein
MPTAYLSPSQLQDLTNVSSTAPGSGDNGKALVWNNTAGKWQAEQVAYSNLSGAPALPIPVVSGGTGTQTGSITGTGALTFTAGGNISLVHAAGGYVGFDRASIGDIPGFVGLLQQLGAPAPKMMVASSSQLNIEYLTASNNPTATPQFFMTRARGSLSAVAPVQEGDRIAGLFGIPFGIELGYTVPGTAGTGFVFEVDGPVTQRNPPSRLKFIGVNFSGGAVDFLVMNSTRTQVPQVTESQNTTSGALQVLGGAGIAGNLNVGGSKVNFANLPTSDASIAVGDLWRDGNVIKVKI